VEELSHTSSSPEQETPTETPEVEVAAESAAVTAAAAATEVADEVVDEPVVDAAAEPVAEAEATVDEPVVEAAAEPVAEAEVDEPVEVAKPPEAAETPEEAEEEVSSMDQASWEDQLEESLSGSTLKRGELREGTIMYRRDDGFVVDIGAKRDGFVPMDDIKDIEGREYNVGDEVAVVVTNFQNSDGNAELSISQAIQQEDWLIAEKLLESQEVYEGTVTGSNRGGLTVAFGRLRGFVPMSQLIGFNRIRQPAERQRRLQGMVDEQVILKVIEVNRRRRRLILSQRAAAKEWRAARRKTLMTELEPGQVRRGRISQITDFGLFVNLGGMDGLVHISELSWGRIEKPSEVYRAGQRVKVKVLGVDRDRERIALSIKALTPDPWESVVVRYQIGSLCQGRVTQVVDFGVFIELEPGVEGLLHNSELLDVAQREELTGGAEILIKVIRIESDRRRIGLSVRQVRPEEWEDWAIAQLEKEAEEAAAKAAADAEAAAKAEAKAAAKAAAAEEAEAAVEETAAVAEEAEAAVEETAADAEEVEAAVEETAAVAEEAEAAVEETAAVAEEAEATVEETAAVAEEAEAAVEEIVAEVEETEAAIEETAAAAEDTPVAEESVPEAGDAEAES